MEPDDFDDGDTTDFDDLSFEDKLEIWAEEAWEDPERNPDRFVEKIDIQKLRNAMRTW